jgi:hypothetical protein
MIHLDKYHDNWLHLFYNFIFHMGYEQKLGWYHYEPPHPNQKKVGPNLIVFLKYLVFLLIHLSMGLHHVSWVFPLVSVSMIK